MMYEVGKYYKVKCMEMRDVTTGKSIKKEPIFVPIFDLLHKDVQFGADFFHYHLDLRFSNKRVEKYFGVFNGVASYVVSEIGSVLGFTYESVGIVTKKLKCKRLTTGLMTPNKNHKYWIWRNSMIGKSCAGKKCPHLGTEMLEVNGSLVCPMHNLVGCKTTEKIVS